ncbi:hypothetical protein, partial [Pseudomonas syringae]|uniref:hypothetical protein n=1 Tax=Pseudomonas syringae TaxID=317 RepID=UPI00217EDC4B
PEDIFLVGTFMIKQIQSCSEQGACHRFLVEGDVVFFVSIHHATPRNRGTLVASSTQGATPDEKRATQAYPSSNQHMP